jgi:hypothetical protein
VQVPLLPPRQIRLNHYGERRLVEDNCAQHSFLIYLPFIECNKLFISQSYDATRNNFFFALRCSTPTPTPTPHSTLTLDKSVPRERFYEPVSCLLLSRSIGEVGFSRLYLFVALIVLHLVTSMYLRGNSYWLLQSEPLSFSVCRLGTQSMAGECPCHRER